MGVLSDLKPQRVFDYFEKICGVPHGSGNTGMICDLVCGFLDNMGIKYVRDELNNIIAYKSASKGYEDHTCVILQGHMDMVCAKADGCDKDMTKEGLDLVVSDGYISARGTSLGGDDGIAVAIMLAILEDKELKHPAIEAVFTVDEEVGMDGARGLDMSLISGRRMINLDSEDEGVFTVSCAGGVRVDCFVPAVRNENAAGKEMSAFKITLDGLLGGHSGCEIDKGRANAIKLMSRVLYWASKEDFDIRLIDLKGGKFDNVICPSCEAAVCVKASKAEGFAGFIKQCDRTLKSEFLTADPGIRLEAEKTVNDGALAFSHEDSCRFFRLLCVIPYGVRSMSRDVEGLVQTSSNVGMIDTGDEGLKFTCSVRSSIRSQKEAVTGMIEAACEQAGGSITLRGDYPGWEFLKDSPLRDILSSVYKEQSGKDPVITAIHAGLECGMFADALDGLDCVSIGPEMHDIHSENERLGIDSASRLYELVITSLERL